jgi:hypothetical protein
MYQLSLNVLSLSWPSRWPRLSCETNLRNRFDNPNYVSWNRLLIEDIMYCKMCVLDTLLIVDLPDSTDLQWFTVWTIVDVQILQSKLRQAICWDRITWLAHLQLQQKRVIVWYLLTNRLLSIPLFGVSWSVYIMFWDGFSLVRFHKKRQRDWASHAFLLERPGLVHIFLKMVRGTILFHNSDDPLFDAVPCF